MNKEENMSRHFSMDSAEDMTMERLKEFIDSHKKLKEEYAQLRNFYMGKHPILTSDKLKPSYKPDNRLVVNYAKYIVDTLNGFFMGIPVKTTSQSETVSDFIRAFEKFNKVDDLNAEISKKCSIYGRCYELLFLDEEARIGATYVDPMEAFIVYDNSIRGRALFGVRYTYTEDGTLIGTISDEGTIKYFEDKNGNIKIIEEEPHYFGEVPMIEYVENEELQGAFENVETLINAYNKAISEKANDVDYFADAYLAILGALIEPEDLEKIKENRIINIKSPVDDKHLEVKFMEKPNADTTQENLIDRLEKLIFNISMVANINDENFGTTSGIALRYKLQSMANLANTKERKFKKGLDRRYELIANIPSSPISPEDLKDIDHIFTRNFPKNIQEEADVARSLQGIVSNETILDNLSIIQDAKAELDRIEEEERFTPEIDYQFEEDHDQEDQEPH